MYYHECPECGVNLDPGEICDCQKENAADNAATLPTAETKSRNTIKLSRTKENVK